MRTLFTILIVLWLCNSQLLFLKSETPRNSAIRGSVVDDQDKPISAHVTVYRLDIHDGKILPVPECFAATDENGFFQCSMVPAGKYALIITSLKKAIPSVVTSEGQGAISPLYIVMLYPNDTGLQPINLIHLREGDTQSADIRYNPESAAAIQINSTIQSTTGLLQIYLNGDDFMIPVIESINIAGSSHEKDQVYEVPRGTYSIIRSWSKDSKGRQAISSIAANSTSLNEVTLSEIDSYNVSGRVKYDDHSPSRASEIVLTSATRELSNVYVTSIETDGSFTLKSILSGTYNVSFRDNGEYYISSLEVYGRPLEGATIDIRSDVLQENFSVRASRAQTYISGTLELNGSEANPSVLVHSIDSPFNLILHVDSNGHFTANNIAPGRYIIYGWDNIDSVPYGSSHFLNRYSDKAEMIDLKNGSRLTDMKVESNNIPW